MLKKNKILMFYKNVAKTLILICLKICLYKLVQNPFPRNLPFTCCHINPWKKYSFVKCKPLLFYKDIHYLMRACQCFKHISNCVPRDITVFVSSPWPSSIWLLVWTILVFSTAQGLSAVRCSSPYCILHIHVSVSHMSYFKNVEFFFISQE